MATENRQPKGMNFYKLTNFKFVKNVKEKTEISVERVYNDKTYHDEIHTGLRGHLTGFMVWDEPVKSDPSKPPYRMVSINLFDGKEKECLQMYFSEFFTFFNRLLNIDLSKEVIIRIMKQAKQKDGKDIVPAAYKPLLLVYQLDADGNEVLIKNVFTKDNNTSEYGALPEVVNAGTEAKPVWVRSHRDEFIENLLNVFNENLRTLNEQKKTEVIKEGAAPETVNETVTGTENTDEIERLAAEQKAELEKEEKAKKAAAKKAAAEKEAVKK